MPLLAYRRGKILHLLIGEQVRGEPLLCLRKMTLTAHELPSRKLKVEPILGGRFSGLGAVKSFVQQTNRILDYIFQVFHQRVPPEGLAFEPTSSGADLQPSAEGPQAHWHISRR